MKTLYKRDSRGKIRILELSTEGSIFVQVSGIIDGKKVRHEKQCKPKNVGKSNATTAEAQAKVELEAKYNIKLSEGYFRDEEMAKAEQVLMPMLAKVYDEHNKKIDWKNAFIQPKLDGQRMIAIKKDGKVTLMSRKNKEITTLDHIKKQLEDPSIPDNVYDGEAYSLEVGTFQEQMKAIKKIGPNTCKIDFNIYDIIIDKPFKERNALINKIFRNGK